MLQLEVVERLAARPGGKNWGRLGIMAQYHCKVDNLFEVPPEAFSPRPKVQSAIVRLTPMQQLPWQACDVTHLRQVVQAAFAQRRKTLRAALGQWAGSPAAAEEILRAAGIDPSERGEQLDVAAFAAIAAAKGRE